MRTVGIVGGIGPESTVDYYRRLLASFRERGAVPDGLLINSIDVARLLALMRTNEVVPFLDTTAIHVEAVVDLVLS